MTARPFPDDFLWGVASAGHQIEGDNRTSDTWFAEHVRPTVFREPRDARATATSCGARASTSPPGWA